MSRGSRSSRGSPGNLPQRQETWHVVVHRLRTWIAPPDEDPWRPYIVLALSVDTGTLHAARVVQNNPTAAEIADALFQGMIKPPKGTRQKPHRPTQVQCEDAALAEALAQQLEPIGITVRQHPRPEGLDTLLCELESHMREGPELADLLSVEGVTPELVGGLFAAAAEFYRAAPWVQLTEENVLAVSVPPEKEARFVQVMGGGGVEYGLATYTRWEDVERMYEMADSPLELLPPEGAHSFLFGDITLLPFGDLEAMEQHGWDVAGKEAYPLPLIFTREKQATRPSRADLEWYEAALRAIPLFVRDHLRADEQGNYLPAEAAFSVPVHSGKTTVHITYPAGALPKETRPVEMDDWAKMDEEEEEEEGFPAFDRRAMEGILAGLGGGFGGSALAEAQDLVYKAWEERNPARRIILAHEALAKSPDCADAYVLLAEEEADTLGRALELYQQGVAAGERALGQDHFVENEGHFWGLLETRPYMRARAGLAECLWQLGRNEEALAHYRDMLRLNPDDNQGIRYTLLNLLLSLNRDAEANALLIQYEEDVMAEWLYTRALLAFRKEGASKEAGRALQAALKQNPYVPAYLSGRKRLPPRTPDYIGWGDENEAVAYASAYLPHWRRTQGALAWLQSHLKPAQATHTKRKTQKGKQGSRKR